MFCGEAFDVSPAVRSDNLVLIIVCIPGQKRLVTMVIKVSQNPRSNYEGNVQAGTIAGLWPDDS